MAPLFRSGVALPQASACASALPYWRWQATGTSAWLTTFGETTGPPNKGMKQTKPSILELRSLSPVLGGPAEQGGL